jgi:hypothetical protein
VESGFDGVPGGTGRFQINRGRTAMNEAKSIDLDDSDQCVDAIADEALERAACTEAGYARAFTVAFCTAQAECPY